LLVNLKRQPEDHSAPQRRPWLGFGLSAAVLAQLAGDSVWGGAVKPVDPQTMQNTDLCRQRTSKRIGHAALTPTISFRSRLRSMRASSSRWWAQSFLAKRELYCNDHADPLHAALGGAVHHRRRRRHDAPQHHRHLHVDRADLNAVNINLVAFSYQLQNGIGQVFAIFVIAVAAAEAAVGLGIILAFYRNKETINIDEMNLMRW
jgi:hypothetical protein